MIRVFIVAASSLARAGLENILTAGGVGIAGSAADLELLPGQLSEIATDAVPIVLVVLAEGLAASSSEGLPAAFQSVLEVASWDELASEVNVVILADQILPEWPAQAFRAGIRALLPSDIAPEQLVAALAAVAGGLLVMHPAEIDAMLPPVSSASVPASMFSPLAELPEPLTRREREVLQMLASGRGNKDIADRLSISEHTVKFHVTSILGKLSAVSRTEAVAIGIRRGLVLL